MNAAIRTDLLLEPRPSDADWVGVDLTEKGWRLAWLRGGKLKQPFGPAFPHINQAAEAARFVRASHGLDQ